MKNFVQKLGTSIAVPILLSTDRVIVKTLMLTSSLEPSLAAMKLALAIFLTVALTLAELSLYLILDLHMVLLQLSSVILSQLHTGNRSAMGTAVVPASTSGPVLGPTMVKNATLAQWIRVHAPCSIAQMSVLRMSFVWKAFTHQFFIPAMMPVWSRAQFAPMAQLTIRMPC